jgi:hypothetical protein
LEQEGLAVLVVLQPNNCPGDIVGPVIEMRKMEGRGNDFRNFL